MEPSYDKCEVYHFITLDRKFSSIFIISKQGKLDIYRSMQSKKVQIEKSWYALLEEEFDKPYFKALSEHIKEAIRSGKIIYPPGTLIFNAFQVTPVEMVKVVIIGQDPYHNPGEAMGLSFSVPKGKRVPPSLKNIFKELQTDLGFVPPDHGDLSHWASQGVLLLNAMLTVEKNRPGSHKSIGWQSFTNAVISNLSEKREHIIFMLWGRFAQSKKELINAKKHLILEAPHPSPLARGGFFGSRHFSKANEFLVKVGKQPISWNLENI